MKVWAIAAAGALAVAGAGYLAFAPGAPTNEAGLTAPGGAVETQAKGDKGVAQSGTGNGIKTGGATGGASGKEDPSLQSQMQHEN